MLYASEARRLGQLYGSVVAGLLVERLVPALLVKVNSTSKFDRQTGL